MEIKVFSLSPITNVKRVDRNLQKQKQDGKGKKDKNSDFKKILKEVQR